jgi:hypothetical protein
MGLSCTRLHCISLQFVTLNFFHLFVGELSRRRLQCVAGHFCRVGCILRCYDIRHNDQLAQRYPRCVDAASSHQLIHYLQLQSNSNGVRMRRWWLQLLCIAFEAVPQQLVLLMGSAVGG